MAHVHDGEGELPATIGRTFAIGITLNVGFVIVEGLYGWRAGSLALLADALHNLSDVGGLLLAWAGLAAAGLAPDDRHTYGWRRGSILASFFNAVLLLVAMGSLAWEAAHRLRSPAALDARTVIVVAAIGVVINAATAALFFRGRKRRPEYPRRLSCTWRRMHWCRWAWWRPAPSTCGAPGPGSIP